MHTYHDTRRSGLVRSGQVLLALIVMLATLLVASPADAAAHESLGNGVTTDGTTFFCNGLEATVHTDAVVNGTGGNDVIIAVGPDVRRVYGRTGHDTMCVLTPGARIYGGFGNDHIFTPDGWGDPSFDTPRVTTTVAGPGDDVIEGGTGLDNIAGGSGDDHVMGGGGVDYLWGGPGTDVIDGGTKGKPSDEGDLCNDFTFGVFNEDTQVGCERDSTDALAEPEMPRVPNYDHDRSAGLSHLPPGQSVGHPIFRLMEDGPLISQSSFG